MKRVLILVVMIGLAASGCADYDYDPTHPIEVARYDEDYATQAAAQFLCGVSNAALSVSEIPWKYSLYEDKVEGSAVGFFRFLGRSVMGVVEILTFLIPAADYEVFDPACAASIVDPHREREVVDDNPVWITNT
jgi:hypothetical protein